MNVFLIFDYTRKPELMLSQGAAKDNNYIMYKVQSTKVLPGKWQIKH
jgi:hypothetical protein